MSKLNKEIKINLQAGEKFKVLAVRFNDGWEFDCPVVILEPFFLIDEKNSRVEDIIEDLFFDILVGYPRYNSDNWRCYPISKFKKQAMDILDGKAVKMKKEFFAAAEYEVTLIKNEDPGLNLDWDVKLLREGSAISIL